MKSLHSASGSLENNTKFIWQEAPKKETKAEIATKETGEVLQESSKEQNILGKTVETRILSPEKRVEKKINELKKIFGIKDIVFQQGANYDYEDVEKNIPNIFMSLMEVKRINPEAIKALSTVTLIANPQGFSVNFDGVKDKDLIAFDYNEDPDEIADDIIEGLIELKKIGEKSSERVVQLTKKLNDIGKKYGIPDGTLRVDGGNIEEYRDVEKSFSNIDQALKMLIQQRPDIIKAIKKSGGKTSDTWSGGNLYCPTVQFLVDFQGIESNFLDDNYEQRDKRVVGTKPAYAGGGKDNIYDMSDRKIISIDYDESPQEIVDDIIDGLVDFEFLSNKKVDKYRILKKINAVAKKYGIKEPEFSEDRGLGNDYNYENLNRHVHVFDEALNKIKVNRPDAIEALKSVPIYINKQGIADLITPNGMASIDYDESSDEIANDIIDALIDMYKISKEYKKEK